MKTRSTAARAAIFGLVLVLLAACRPGPASLPAAVSPPAPGAEALGVVPVLKIVTQTEGLYELTAQELTQAGWDRQTVQAGQLVYQGQAYPLWIDGDGQHLKLRFYAPPALSRYTRENVFWFVPGETPAAEVRGMFAVAAGRQENDRYFALDLALPEAPAGTYTAYQVLEENQVFNPQTEGSDHWFWVSLAAPREQALEFDLEGVQTAPARLRLTVWGTTQAPDAVDHRLVLTVNNHQVADASWDGKGAHVIEADLEPGWLVNGKNTVGVSLPGLDNVPADIQLLDRLELVFLRQMKPQSDRLELRGVAGQPEWKDFSGEVQVYDVTDPLQPERLAPAVSLAADRRYLAVGARGYLKPVSISPLRMQPDLRAEGLGADWVAVGPADLLAELQPLEARRSQQGLKTLLVPVETVYDQFNAGMPEPQAVQALLAYASQNWQPAPRFLLLVGDASYDPLGYIAPPEANRLPTFLVNTVYGGVTASDLHFGLLDDDLQPDLAVGRLPARQPQQVATAVQKILRFEQPGAENAWRQKVLAVADGQETLFAADAQSFLDQFADGYQTELLAPKAGAQGVNAQILERMNSGVGLVAYFGHGSVNMWGKDRLFTTEDALALKNGDHLPVMVNMTCLNGLFAHPKVESLAETLLWNEQGGAVAVLAPTSLTLPADQSFLVGALVQALQSEAPLTLGQALQQALRQVPAGTPGAMDVLQTFLLFGDPALRVRN